LEKNKKNIKSKSHGFLGTLKIKNKIYIYTTNKQTKQNKTIKTIK